MKNVILVLAMAMSASYASAQKITASQVPATVIAAFQKKFPTATDVNWEKENATEYEAAFKTGKTEYSVKYDKDAKWLETETEIEASALPAVVSQSLSAQYAAYKVKEVEKVETHDSGLLYEIEMTKGSEKIEVRFSPEGKVLNTAKAGKD